MGDFAAGSHEDERMDAEDHWSWRRLYIGIFLDLELGKQLK